MRIIIVSLLLILPVVLQWADTAEARRVHRNGLTICSLIITEMAEGRLTYSEAHKISSAIAEAGNKHFGKVTCGDMWLYMAIVYVESGFRNNIVNYKNCWGMFQIHAPSWARKFGLRYKDLHDLELNADAGLRVYKYYLDRYKRVGPALSAYNSDHPYAARGYARAVLGVRKRIKRRYTELFELIEAREHVALTSR